MRILDRISRDSFVRVWCAQMSTVWRGYVHLAAGVICRHEHNARNRRHGRVLGRCWCAHLERLPAVMAQCNTHPLIEWWSLKRISTQAHKHTSTQARNHSENPPFPCSAALCLWLFLCLFVSLSPAHSLALSDAHTLSHAITGASDRSFVVEILGLEDNVADSDRYPPPPRTHTLYEHTPYTYIHAHT